MRNILSLVVAIGSLAYSSAHGQTARSEEAAAPRIPLCPGLTIVTAVNEIRGDYESIKKVESVTPSVVRITYSAEIARDGNAAEAPVKKVRSVRTVRREDLSTATRYARFFGEALPETLPGTTALGTSSAVLKALKSTGEAQLAVPNEGLLAALERAGGGEMEFHSQSIRRVSAGPVKVPVLVNGARVELPAIHARGKFFGQEAEFFFLDDLDNPLALKYTVARGEFADLLGEMTKLFGAGSAGGNTRDLLQAVNISYKCANPPASLAGGIPGEDSSGGAGKADPAATRTLEQALAETGRADVYSIHFSFNSDQIREASDPTLKEIAGLLTRHADWKLSIEGHTDSIASDSFNLDLSRRRAAAVKDALVKRYRIDSKRLTAAGYGESRPKDTNDTLEGRARNRRVELVRSAP